MPLLIVIFPIQIVQMMFPSPIFGTNSCYKPKINPSECPLVTSKPGIFSSSTALRANSSSARFCRHLAGHSPAICGVRGNPSGIFHPVGHATFRHSKSTSERGMEQECCCYRPSSWFLMIIDHSSMLYNPSWWSIINKMSVAHANMIKKDVANCCHTFSLSAAPTQPLVTSTSLELIEEMLQTTKVRIHPVDWPN